MFFTTMNLVQSIHLATLAARAPSSRHAGGVGVLRSLSLSAPTGLRRPTFSNQLLSDQEGPPLCLPTKPTQHQRERSFSGKCTKRHLISSCFTGTWFRSQGHYSTSPHSASAGGKSDLSVTCIYCTCAVLLF